MNLQIKWRGMLVLDRVLDVSMNHASLVAWPNISFGLERTLFRYKGTFSPQLHAFRYEGRAACTSLCICHCKMKLHHVAHQVDIGVASLGILCMHSLFDRNLYLVSLRPTIFDSAYCYVQPTCLAHSSAAMIPCSATTSPFLHVLS